MDRYQRRVLRLREHVLGKTKQEDVKQEETFDYDNATKADITALLDEREIEYNARDTKQDLYDLLQGRE